MREQLVFDAPLGPEIFYGRINLIERICERLRRPQFQSSTVVGGPKMGKTSLFRFLCSDRADSHYQGKTLIRIYFDAQIVGSNSTEHDFWTGVLAGLSEKNSSGSVVGLLNEKLAKASSQKLTKFDVFDVFDTFAKIGTPVALFADNFDTPLRNEHFWTGSDFYHNLRFLDEREPRGLCYVVATCRPLRDYWRPAAVSPFFNTWLDFALAPLTPEDLAPWVERWLDGTKKSDEKTIQNIVSKFSHGHPFIANFVLGLCIDQSLRGEKPNATMIEKELRATGGPGPMLMQRILAELVPFEREMLRSLSGEQPLPPAKVRTLQRLANYGLLPPGTMIPEEAT